MLELSRLSGYVIVSRTILTEVLGQLIQRSITGLTTSLRWQATGVVGALTLTASILIVSPGFNATAGEVFDRDTVWRGIFSRPALAPDPETNRSNPAKIALGFSLFRDPRLSADGTMACATCHQPDRGFTDGRPKAKARDGSDLQRNTPSLYNLSWSTHFFWDGRAASLEDQAHQPMTAANEMAADLTIVAERLSKDRVAAALFARAFPETQAVTDATIVAALAAYERTLISPPSAFDRWIDGDDDALSSSQQRGFAIYTGKAGCVGCHGGWRMTDNGFHDIGLKSDDPGRSIISGGVPGSRQFKTPGLRELAHTAPYMHDGALRTLRDVINHYAGGFERRPSLDSNLVRELELSDEEKSDLEAFLLSASSTAK